VSAAVLVDEIANEVNSWPGVRIERRSDGGAVVCYEHLELGVLDRARSVAELRFSHPEHDALIEHGEAEPADPTPDSDVVSHRVNGPSAAATATCAAKTTRTARRTRPEPAVAGAGQASRMMRKITAREA
jgi:hypothetical protein